MISRRHSLSEAILRTGNYGAAGWLIEGDLVLRATGGVYYPSGQARSCRFTPVDPRARRLSLRVRTFNRLCRHYMSTVPEPDHVTRGGSEPHSLESPP